MLRNTQMGQTHPHIPFERYADDVICHCRSEEEAQHLGEQVADRLAACGLELNRRKTRLVYCQDSNRRGQYPEISFDFLGYTFRPRRSKGPRGPFVSFSPAVSRLALKAMHRTLRQWRLHRRTDKKLSDLAHMFNPIMRGWLPLLRTVLPVGPVSVSQPLQPDLGEVDAAEV